MNTHTDTAIQAAASTLLFILLLIGGYATLAVQGVVPAASWSPLGSVAQQAPAPQEQSTIFNPSAHLDTSRMKNS